MDGKHLNLECPIIESTRRLNYTSGVKIFIAYKFDGEDKVKLRGILQRVSKILEDYGYETFEFYRDVQNWGFAQDLLSDKEIIDKALQEISNCDELLAIVNSKEKSAGMLIEVGCAKALRKKVILAVNDNVKSDVDRLLLAVADRVINFKEVEDLELLLPGLV